MTDRERLAYLKTEMDLLRSAVDQYHHLSFEHSKLAEKILKEDREDTLNQLISETKFIECKYPSIGWPGEIGVAEFVSEDQAQALIAILKSSDYTYGYILKWDGPGQYIVDPDFDYDHDGDVIYTATFVKAES